jgi:hypothetical protein
MGGISLGNGVVATDTPTSSQITGALGYTPPHVFVGSSTPAANGVLTSFSFAHGAGSLPTYVNVTFKNVLSAALNFVTWDSTNITVTYLTAPLTGALAFTWLAVV